MFNYREPANSLIQYMGGAAKVAEITGLQITVVYRWRYPKTHGGRSGFITDKNKIKLLKYASENGIDLRIDDFFSADRIKAIMKKEPLKYQLRRSGRPKKST